MAGRNIHATSVAALQSNIIRPVLIGKLDFLGDPVHAWTGPNNFVPVGTADTVLNGNIYSEFAPFLALGTITENQGNGAPVTLTLSGHDLDEIALRQIVRDKRQWRGRRAYLWLGLLSSNEMTVLQDPIRIKTGVMTQFTVTRDGSEHVVTVTIDDDFGNARSAPWRILDHPRIFPADTFTAYLVSLANKPSGPDNYDSQPTNGIDDAELEVARQAALDMGRAMF